MPMTRFRCRLLPTGLSFQSNSPAVGASLLLVGTLLFAAAPFCGHLLAQDDAPASAPADPADVASIDAIITALYAVISGDAGEARDWDRFRSLFAPGGTLSPVGRESGVGRYGRSVITPQQYEGQVSDYFRENGFHETELHRVTERYGVIAHAFSTYESRVRASDPEPFARGINSIQLLNDGARWWIVSIFWLAEGPDHPLPPEYLPSPPQP